MARGSDEPDQPVSLVLPRPVALVVFDCLARLIDRDGARDLRRLTQDDAEIWALNSILVQLESMICEPFSRNFAAAVQAARKTVQSENGGPWPLSDA